MGVPRQGRTYVAVVIAAGTVTIALAVAALLRDPPRIDFYYLAALTIAGALLPVKVPKVSANISVSETFVYAGTLLVGPAAGVTLVVLDAVTVWLKLWLTESSNWRRMLFSITASALAIGVAGVALSAIVGAPLAAIAPAERPGIWRFTGGVIVFTIVYFLLNSWLVAVAIALEQRGRAFAIWRGNFSTLWVNYLAGASLATLLVYNTLGVAPAFLVIIAPVLLVIFLTYRSSADRVAAAELHLAEMNQTFLETIEAFAMAVDAKDQVTHGHIRRVQRNTMELARALGIEDPNLLDALRAAALLHDTGKLAVPEYILNKPGRLSAAEFETMKQHASIGADILKKIHFPYPVEPIVRHHHENWDGSGYPAGLRGATIPIGARVLSVVDCYDAIRSDRPYRMRMSRAEAEQVLRDRRGTMYDPDVVDAFLGLIDRLEALDLGDPSGEEGPIAAIAAAARHQLAFQRAGERWSTDNLPTAAEMVLWHLRRVAPVLTVAIFQPAAGTGELVVTSCAGAGAVSVGALHLAVGAGITGWAYAHQQSVLNSDAALDLGPLAGQDGAMLAFAVAVPVLRGTDCVLVVTAYGSERFTEEHRGILESMSRLVHFGFATGRDAAPAGY